MIPFFSKDEEALIIESIKDAERTTSGEIRVHLESKPEGELLKMAARTFTELKMDQTHQRNGVLIYLIPQRREFAIIGDEGINSAVPKDFWEEVRDVMAHHFRENAFAQGVQEAIRMAGEKLQAYFPYADDDINELPDEITMS